MTQSLDSDEPAILPDDYGGGQARRQHLLAAGRTRVGHITGPERFLAARKRAGGFCEALASAGAQFSPNDVLYGEWSERWGREGARILLRSSPDVEAIFCGSDQIARGVSDTLRLLGHRVPDDIALIGFDNWEPMAVGCGPPADQHRHVPGGRRPDGGRAPALRDQRRADARRAHRAVPPGGPRSPPILSPATRLRSGRSDARSAAARATVFSGAPAQPSAAARPRNRLQRHARAAVVATGPVAAASPSAGN